VDFVEKPVDKFKTFKAKILNHTVWYTSIASLLCVNWSLILSRPRSGWTEEGDDKGAINSVQLDDIIQGGPTV